MGRARDRRPWLRLGIAASGLVVLAAPAVTSHAAGTPSALTLGSEHSCALRASGGLYCWGAGITGAVGNGSNVVNTPPSPVSGLGAGVAGVGAGEADTCAQTSGGAMLCWGDNSWGQLGDGTTTSRNEPVGVSGLGSGVTAIAVGGRHTCAVVAGGVRCWGRNDLGQAGQGFFGPDPHLPVAVVGLGGGVSALAAGYAHTCALTTAAAVKCWGDGGSGQLGDDTTGGHRSATPTDVPGLGPVAAIAAGGEETCALTTAGGVKCWGRNVNGQVGDGSMENYRPPVGVAGLSSGVAGIAVGVAHACAVTTGGGVKCWGDNTAGQLGDGTTTSRRTPVDVPGLSGVVAVAAGGRHTCARTAAGGVACWGDDNRGQLGDWTITPRSTPGPVLFEQPKPPTLTVRTDGPGTIIANPPGATCPTDCVRTYARGTVVSLTAGGNRGAPFLGWSGDCTGMAFCSVTMDGDRSVTAKFGAIPSPPAATRCVVPNVRKKSLSDARRLVARSHCGVGTVRRVYSGTVRTGRVVAQHPAPGARVAAGSKVGLTVSKGRRPRTRH